MAETNPAGKNSSEGQQGRHGDPIGSADFEEKVSSLRDSIDTFNREVSSYNEKEKWSAERKTHYIENIDNLQQKIQELESEWYKLSDNMSKQDQRLDTLFSSFPDVVDLGALKLLSQRLNQLERIVSEHINEERSREVSRSSRYQLIISAVMLSVTVILWGFWILIQFI